MPTTRKIPRTFEALVAVMPPQAIMDEVQYANTVEMIDRLMASGRNFTLKHWLYRRSNSHGVGRLQ